MRLRRALRALAVLGALAAAAVALTTLGGWAAFLDATGISEVTQSRELYRALDSQCSQIEASYPDDTVSCGTEVQFAQDLKMACADLGHVPVDHFVIATYGTAQISPMTCP
jgi:hypothetical protein